MWSRANLDRGERRERLATWENRTEDLSVGGVETYFDRERWLRNGEMFAGEPVTAGRVKILFNVDEEKRREKEGRRIRILLKQDRKFCVTSNKMIIYESDISLASALFDVRGLFFHSRM